jgi:hypothetical protein
MKYEVHVYKTTRFVKIIEADDPHDACTQANFDTPVYDGWDEDYDYASFTVDAEEIEEAEEEQCPA